MQFMKSLASLLKSRKSKRNFQDKTQNIASFAYIQRRKMIFCVVLSWSLNDSIHGALASRLSDWRRDAKKQITVETHRYGTYKQ